MSFAPAVNYAAGADPRDIITADFNNDGRLDLVVANIETVSFRPGDGSGAFGDAITSAAASTASNAQDRSLSVGDFNNDGKLDLAMVNDYALTGYGYSDPDPSNGVSVMLGNGDGSFRAPLNVPLYHGAKATSVAVGDFNADGTMDLAVASVTDPYYPGDVYEDRGLASVLLGNGDGSFRLQDGAGVDRGYGISRTTPAAVALAVADFNGDGNQDFVVGTRNFGFDTGDTVEEVAMLLGDGQGNIASESWWRLDHGWSMAAGDLDGDGDADLVTVSNSQVHVRLGNGTGGFDAPAAGVSYASGPGAFKLVLGDFNRDGKLDIATANTVGDNISVLRNNGNGTFSQPDFFPTGPGTNAIAAGDFSGDGWLDLATTNNGGNTTSVLINDQSWGTSPPTVSIGDTMVTEGNTGTLNASFIVRLSKPSTAAVTVSYATADETATAGTDYVAKTGTLTIPAGQTSGTFTVAVIGDRIVEAAETFVVHLTSSTNATIADGSASAVILDNEPRISIGNVSKSEGNNKTTTFSFTVSLSTVYDEAVTVNYATANGTAVAGSDYQAKSGSVTFAPGETVKTITIVVNGDRVKESNETFFVDLLGPSSNAVIGVARGTGTIFNDDKR